LFLAGVQKPAQLRTHAPQQIRSIRHLVAGRLSIGCAITGLSATAVSNHVGRPADVWSIPGRRSQAKSCSISAIDSHRAAARDSDAGDRSQRNPKIIRVEVILLSTQEFEARFQSAAVAIGERERPAKGAGKLLGDGKAKPGATGFAIARSL